METAFGWCPALEQRRIVTGVNWSVALGNPFRSFGRTGEGLESLLAEQRAGRNEPVVFVLHFVCPRAQYTDRGKSAIVLLTSPAAAITGAVRAVTKDWARQRKAEERDRNAVLNRRTSLVRSTLRTIKDAAFEVMANAYDAASGGGRLPVKPRQIMYRARPYILRATGENHLTDSYFTQSLLIEYMEVKDCSDWDIIWDARGHFVEPHTRHRVELGTLEVRQYLGLRPSFDPPKTSLMFPTVGPKNRYRCILYIEKEGFHPILEAARLQERFDIGLMSNKGMSVTASRMLLDRLSHLVDKVFVLRDFDLSGFSIFGTLGTSSRRYRYRGERSQFIDLGLRLDDALAMGLEAEPVPQDDLYKWRKRANTLRRHGATEAEIEFLRDERIELNAMSSPQLVEFVERKLTEHSVKKLVPDDQILDQQARRVIKARLTQEVLAAAENNIEQQTQTAALPEDFRQQVEHILDEHPEMPWDEAVAQVLGGEGG